ncbi:DUF2975 domain-containing protein [Acetobacterium sp.]|jgi:hypothetical protein|uniref:DUF2975 domain-containing protein n=1 Tax=Acetobacterium sp. TaxID=1872094 RepID=UPI000CA6B20B|nr:DUF2975 domain-containing protein [Acetobacterium sp.]MDO9491217.1 DUF2975 domain-containing protein [Acetobacterium sp.]PKM71139.1 MAG: DUF2975 domain-containing protein [Firmicutes bacterium HGW-Firmicutes-17]
MNNRKTTFLKITILVIGLVVLLLCVFYLPWLAEYISKQNTELSYLKYPLLIGIYLTTVPFYLALFEGFRLLVYIEREHAFSQQGVISLNYIKLCAISIAVLYGIGSLALFTINLLVPILILLGGIIIFASASIAIFAAVLQELLRTALEIKSENDLTV